MLSIFSFSVYPRTNQEIPAWSDTLAANIRAPSNIVVQNGCKKKHDFEIQPENVPFLEITKTEVSVKGGKNFTVPVFFNTTNISPGIHEGQVLVICKSCGRKPTCTQDREVLQVILTILPDASSMPTTLNTSASTLQDPCEQLRIKCDDLLKIALAKEGIANTKKNLADQAQTRDVRADQDAKDAEQAALAAEAFTAFPPPSGRGSVDGKQEYTTADTAYLDQINAQLWTDWRSGKISADEYEKQLNANTIVKARLERIKNEAKLKREAKDARQKANDARKAAVKAKTDAKVLPVSPMPREKLRKASEDCIKKRQEAADQRF